MRKKFGIVFGIVFGFGMLFLGGCSVSQEKTNMSFDEAYTVFVDGLFSSDAFALADVMNENKIKDELLLVMEGGNQDMDLELNLDLNSFTVLQSGDSQTMADFEIYRYDKVKKQPLTMSGVLEFLFLDQNLYTQIHKFWMDSGRGNAEANLIKLVLDNYVSTRILMDDPNTIDVKHMDSSMIVSSYQMPKKIKKALKKHNIFVVDDRKIVDIELGQTYYPVKINTEEFALFLDELGVTETSMINKKLFSGLVLDAYLLVEDEHNVGLFLNTFNFADNLLVEGKIAPRTIELSVNNTPKNMSYDLSFKERRDEIALDLSFVNGNNEDTQISLDIIPSLSEFGLDFLFDGELQIVPLSFYDPIVLDVDGVYSLEKADFDPFVIPETPLLLNQLLGDQFALSAMIEQTEE